MGATTIEWCHFTFNPWIGCEKVSAGCKFCYASNETPVRVARSKGRELWGAAGERQVTGDANWRAPRAWDRAAKAAGERRRVFCASLADVFEDRPELESWRDGLWNLILETPNLDWLLLTKRSENLERMLPWGKYGATSRPWRNVWLGVSVEDQRRADERIPHLFSTPAAVRFLSVEPLIAPVDLSRYAGALSATVVKADSSGGTLRLNGRALHWVIVGGESGPGARPCAIEWVQSIVDQCRSAEVACFVKQLGARPVNLACRDCDHGREDHPAPLPSPCVHGRTDPMSLDSNAPGYGCKCVGFLGMARLADKKGGDPLKWPESLRVRQFPAVAR